ncbi:ABC transporter permease [Streptomyces sp. ODS28]|uniref:ABC transporter permease n=1 Tax=Streptomyces sp. ODS28 TaxID=3136688 RepID=UPI0031F19A30
MNIPRRPAPPPALAVTRASLTRMLRDRTALFFMVLLPVAVILVIGATVSDFDRFRVGVVSAPSGPVAAELTAALDASPGLKTRHYADTGAARTALRRVELDAVVVVPRHLDAAVRGGREVTVPVLVEPHGSAGPAAVSSVSAAIAQHAGRLQAARFAVRETGGSFQERLATAHQAQRHTDPVRVVTHTAGGSSRFLPLGYSYSTPTMLVLFVFINALAFGSALVQTRQLGVHARALAAPLGARSIVLGETLAYAALALLQSLLIVAVGTLVFGISWGDPLAAGALLLVWALVGTGAGMLSGAAFRTPEQAGAIGPALGIGLGMLGGCMWPLAVVPGWLRAAGHAAPHAWAVDGWTEILSHGAGLSGVAHQLGVLAAFAAGLLSLAAVLLHRRLTRA